MPSEQLGRYRLQEPLGGGGMGVVYRAVAEGPQGFARPCVIKRIRPHLARDPAFMRMLIVEARLSAVLRHPGIVQVYELGEHQGEYFLVMEAVDGYDLLSVMKRAAQIGSQVPLSVACFMVSEVAAALGYAHALRDDQGRPYEIVHRDVSPSNIMLTVSGAVKLLDFGIAKAAHHMRDEETRTGTLKGKLSYMSPEQAEGLDLDGRSDIFALGIVAHECLTGRRLFRAEDDFKTLRRIKEARADPPSKLRADVDSELDALVLKMLAREPGERFPSGDALMEAMAPLVQREGGGAIAVRKYLQQLEPIAHKSPDSDPLAVPAVEAEAAATVPESSPTTPNRRAPMTSTTAPTSPISKVTVPYPPARPLWASRPLILGAIAGAVIVSGWALFSQRAPLPASIPAPVVDDPALTAPSELATAAPAVVEKTSSPPARSRSDAAKSARPKTEARPPGLGAPGTLRFKAAPWAEVRVDGESIGVTPLPPRRMPPGSHEVSFTYRPTGGAPRTQRRTVTVSSGEEQLVEVDLRTP